MNKYAREAFEALSWIEVLIEDFKKEKGDGRSYNRRLEKL